MLKIVLIGLVGFIVGYFCGSFSTGYFVGKSKGTDIRNEGSGSTGTTNALRNYGPAGALITFLGDLLKAVIPTVFMKYIFCAYVMNFPADVTYLLTLCVGLGVVCGHNFPFYLHFKGGKGIAVSAAVIIVSSMYWPFILIGLIGFILLVAITKYVSVGSLFVVWYFPIYSMFAYHNSPYIVALMIVSLAFTALAYYKHRGNIQRLMSGTENKISFKK